MWIVIPVLSPTTEGEALPQSRPLCLTEALESVTEDVCMIYYRIQTLTQTIKNGDKEYHRRDYLSSKGILLPLSRSPLVLWAWDNKIWMGLIEQVHLQLYRWQMWQGTDVPPNIHGTCKWIGQMGLNGLEFKEDIAISVCAWYLQKNQKFTFMVAPRQVADEVLLL